MGDFFKFCGLLIKSKLYRRGAESPKGTEVKKVRFEEESKLEEIKKETNFNTVDDKSIDINRVTENVEVQKESENNKQTQQKVQKPQQSKFQYGNYSRYYGYRLEGSDPRLRFFNPNWFADKDVLDIGCNVGEVSFFSYPRF